MKSTNRDISLLEIIKISRSSRSSNFNSTTKDLSDKNGPPDEDNIPDYPGDGLIQHKVKNARLQRLGHSAVSWITFCYIQ